MAVRNMKKSSPPEDVRFCRKWFGAADRMRRLLHGDGEGFDPLSYNETATVGFLVAAAGRAGLVALPEFTEENRRLPKGRVRAGRCDLWVASEDWETNWLIEFKLFRYRPNSTAAMATALNAAMTNVADRDNTEAGRRFGCVVLTPAKAWDERPKERAEWSSPRAIEILARQVELAFRLDGSTGPAYFLLKEFPPLARNVDRYLVDKAKFRKSLL